MGTIFFFASGNAVYNDKIIPIVLELARQGNAVNVVILDHYSFEYCSAYGVYSNWLKTFTRLRNIIVKEQPSFLEKVLSRMKYLLLIVEMMLRKNYIVFLDPKMAGAMESVNALARRRGLSIVYSANYVDTWGDDLNWGKVLRDDDVCLRLKGKTFKEYQKRTRSPQRAITCDSVLVYNKNLIQQEKGTNAKKHHTVPHPKLQPWWNAFCQEHPPIYDHPRLMNETQWISLFLTYKGNYLFQDGSDLDVLVPEIVQSIRTVFPSTLIVIKPKISKGKPLAVQQETTWFQGFLKDLKDENVIVSTSPVALLARKSIVGISTGLTTAQFEFMVEKAPWIDYCRYSDFWKKIYPKLTYTESYGGFWAQTPEELEGLLERVKSGELRSDLKKFKKQINFYNQDISFDFFLHEGGRYENV